MINNKEKSLIALALSSILATTAFGASYGNGSADHGITQASFNAGNIPTRSATVSTKTSTAINNQLEDHSAQGGGITKLQDGRYDITSSVVMQTKTAVKGNGSSKSFLRRNRNASAMSSSASRPFIVDASGKNNFEIVSLTTDGNHLMSELNSGSAGSVAGIVFGDDCSNANIWSCKSSRNAMGYLGGDMQDLRIVHSVFQENGNGTNGLHHNIYMRRTGRLYLSNVDSNYAVGGHGFKIWGNTTGSIHVTKDLWVTGSDFIDNDHTNFSFHSFTWARIENSKFNSANGDDWHYQAAIYVGDADGRGCDRVDVINNVVRWNSHNGIRVNGSNRVNIEGNYSNNNDDNYDVSDSTNVSNDNNTSW